MMIRNLLLSAAAVMLAPGAAQAAWYEASSKHFVVYANDKPEKVKAFTEKLERFDKAIRVWHISPEDNRGPASRVTIFVIDNPDQIQKLAGIPNVAGFYAARASGPVAFTPRGDGGGDLSSQAVLFHEYTHHWMLTTWADAGFPYWFVEGFAELHATAIVGDDDSITFGAGPVYRRYTVGGDGSMPASYLLRALPSDNLNDRERDGIYSRGWLLMHYLTFDPARRRDLANYIVAINSGKSIKEAAKFIGDPFTLDAKMNVWVRQRKYPSARFTAAELPISPVTIRPLTAGEASVMPALIASRAGVSPKTAPQVVALARSAAAAFPTDTGAQNELAEAEFDLASGLKVDADALAAFARAEAAADRAYAADPKSVHALLYKGMAQEEIAKRNKVTDPVKWAAIRRWFLLANKVDTEDPEPLVQYYDSFELAGQKPSANADDGLIYAYLLAPFDTGLRVRAGKVFLQKDDTKRARIALAPVAYNAENRVQSLKAQKALAALDANDVPGAIAALVDKPEPKKPS